MAPVWGILADFWVPHEIKSCNLQNLLVFGFPETSQNLISFRQFLFSLLQYPKNPKKQKSAKMAPNRGQDDLLLLIFEITKWAIEWEITSKNAYSDLKLVIAKKLFTSWFKELQRPKSECVKL